MINRRQRREHNLPEVTWRQLSNLKVFFVFVLFLLSFNVHLVSLQEYLYGQTTKSLSYNDFVNKELVLYSNSDNERSIPCLVDGGLNSMSVKKVISNLEEKFASSIQLMCSCECVYVRSETRPEESVVLLL